MVKYKLFLYFVVIALSAPCFAQTWGSNAELNMLEGYYVKSLNEFMHRFNADEIPPFIKEEMGIDIRRKCVLALFDFDQLSSAESEMAKRIMKFDSVVCVSNSLLSIDKQGLYAEARCAFRYKKQEIELSLVLVYEKMRDGYYKWALAGANGLTEAGLIDTIRRGYINPVQHELHFSELEGAFPHMSGFLERDRVVDQLSFVAGLAESGVLQLIGCQSVTYWFTQIPGYVFSVSLHPRLGGNAGWLIHDLMEIPDKDKTLFIDNLKGVI